MTAVYLKLNKNVIAIVIIAITISLAGLLLINNAPLANRDKVATGFLCDLLITFPVCYYFVIIRPLKKRVTQLVLVLSICCSIAYLVLPAHQRTLILQVRRFTAVAELAFIVYIITQIKKIRSAYKSEAAVFPDPLYNLRAAMTAVLGDVFFVKVLASELAMLRYGLLCWKKEASVPTQIKSFSTHRESNYIAVWCILLLAVIVEIVAFHFLLMRWSKTAANIITSLSAYAVIFFIADLSAILKRRVLTDGYTLILRTGLRWRALVQKSNIISIEKISNDYNTDEIYLKGGTLKSNANVLIKFKSPVTVDKLYGRSKQYQSILMSIDNVQNLIDELSLQIQA